MKKILGLYSSPRPHWVGDGFPVRSILSHGTHGDHMSPFLLLDYAGPADFSPAEAPRGVGQHPHRGFETVTIVYQGEVEHRDSTGQGGLIGPGDVQWMTAAAGILHEEFHSRDFTRKGGALEMIQLWVNLPAKDKMAAPGYQTLLARDIPEIALAGHAGSLRVIAGAYAGHQGPARTFTPIDIWDVRLMHGKRTTLDFPAGRTVGLVVLSGSLRVNDAQNAGPAQFVLFDREAGTVALEALSDAKILVLSGEPIDEAVVMHGPFVMNTPDEIRAAMADFQAGRFGTIAPMETNQRPG
ncbi:MAG: pirin family protein [Parvibaculaceae bacterium]